MKGKLQRSNRVYICSSYDNLGKDQCERNPVAEEELLNLLEMRYGKILNQEEIKEEVESVKVSPEEIIINVKNGQPIILNTKYAQF